jgi:uncharacterized FlaG/YvyC family protein
MANEIGEIMRINSATDTSFAVVTLEKAASSQNHSRPSLQEPHVNLTFDAASAYKTSDRDSGNNIRVELERKGMEISFSVDPSSGRAQMVVVESGTGREVLKVPSDSALHNILINEMQGST